jgi:hypothetical protein
MGFYAITLGFDLSSITKVNAALNMSIHFFTRHQLPATRYFPVPPEPHSAQADCASSRQTLVPRLWTLDSVYIATKRLKFHKNVERRDTSIKSHRFHAALQPSQLDFDCMSQR